MNSTPADSSARRTAKSFAAVIEVSFSAPSALLSLHSQLSYLCTLSSLISALSALLSLHSQLSYLCTLSSLNCGKAQRCLAGEVRCAPSKKSAASRLRTRSPTYRRKRPTTLRPQSEPTGIPARPRQHPYVTPSGRRRTRPLRSTRSIIGSTPARAAALAEALEG